MIAYFGILYPFRDPRPVFAAIDQLAHEGAIDLSMVRVRFYGTPRFQVEANANGFGCQNVVETPPRVWRAEMLELQRDASVLLNLQSAEAGGAVPSKLLEYLGAGRPILNVPGDGGPIDEVVRRTNSGVTARNETEIADALRAWFAEWRLRGVTSVAINEEAAMGYTRRGQAKLLAELLNATCSIHQGRCGCTGETDA